MVALCSVGFDQSVRRRKDLPHLEEEYRLLHQAHQAHLAPRSPERRAQLLQKRTGSLVEECVLSLSADLHEGDIGKTGLVEG